MKTRQVTQIWAVAMGVTLCFITACQSEPGPPYSEAPIHCKSTVGGSAYEFTYKSIDFPGVSKEQTILIDPFICAEPEGILVHERDCSKNESWEHIATVPYPPGCHVSNLNWADVYFPGGSLLITISCKIFTSFSFMGA